MRSSETYSARNAEREAQQPRHLTHRLDQPHRGRSRGELFHREVVEQRLPYLEPEVQHEVGEDDEDQQPPVVFQDIAHAQFPFRCSAIIAGRGDGVNQRAGWGMGR